MKTNPLLSTKTRRSLGIALVVAAAAVGHAQTSGSSGSSTTPGTGSNEYRADKDTHSTTNSTYGTSTTAGTSNEMGGRELSSGDRRAVQKAAKLGEKEVSLSRIAQDRAANPDVKAFASEMVREHSNANSELQQFIQRRGIQLDLDDRADVRGDEKKWLDKRADDFDKDYLKAMIDAHEDTVDVLEKGAESKDSELAAWSNKQLPSVRMHLKRAEALKKQLKD